MGMAFTMSIFKDYTLHAEGMTAISRFKWICTCFAVVLPFFASVAMAQTDQYGGTLAIKREATGFFRSEKAADRWMFITPEGHGFIALGMIFQCGSNPKHLDLNGYAK
jgi:hypothetical protein